MSVVGCRGTVEEARGPRRWPRATTRTRERSPRDRREREQRDQLPQFRLRRWGQAGDRGVDAGERFGERRGARRLVRRQRACEQHGRDRRRSRVAVGVERGRAIRAGRGGTAQPRRRGERRPRRRAPVTMNVRRERHDRETHLNRRGIERINLRWATGMTAGRAVRPARLWPCHSPWPLPMAEPPAPFPPATPSCASSTRVLAPPRRARQQSDPRRLARAPRRLAVAPLADDVRRSRSRHALRRGDRVLPERPLQRRRLQPARRRPRARRAR